MGISIFVGLSLVMALLGITAIWLVIVNRRLARERASLLEERSILETTHRSEYMALTRQKEHLEALHAEAQLDNRAKNTFCANMSHEIRTPMTAILGLSELCLRTELNAVQTDYLDKVHNTARSMLDVLNEILDFSIIEANEIRLDHTPFDVDSLIEDVYTVESAKISEKQLEFFYHRESSVPNSLVGDPLRVKQILTNLTDNAVKFTNSGHIFIKIRLNALDGDKAQIEFLVEDTGRGISEEQLDELFLPFVQEDSSISRRYGGTGLGLAIAKRLATLMDGEITVNSSPAKGSCFRFAVPLSINDDRDINALVGQLPADQVHGLRTLLITKRGYLQDIVSHYLSAFRLTVEVRGDIAEALLQFRENDQPFDAILIDRHVSDIHSTDSLARTMGSASRLILLGDDELEDSVIPQESLNGLVRLPITPSRLFDTLVAVLDLSHLLPGSRKTEFLGTGTQDATTARILLVEDNEINRQVACELLQQAGFEVEVATNGLEALLAVEKTIFDCVLMDLQMPEMDGFEATRRIRHRDRFRDLPVLAMSANTIAEDHQKIYEMGMDGYIAKPIDSAALLDAVFKAVSVASPNPQVQLEFEKKPATESMSDIVLDKEQGVRNVNGNEPLYHKLLSQFIADHGDDASITRRAIEDSDFETARITIHTLKGVAGTVGAARSRDLAACIDQQLKHHQHPDEKLLDQLEEALADVIHAVGAGSKDSAESGCSTASTVSIDTPALKQLRTLLEDMNPEAEYALETLRPALGKFDHELIEGLVSRVKNYEFEDALDSLDQVERIIARGT